MGVIDDRVIDHRSADGPWPLKRPRISLLHATHRREGGPLEIKRAWLEAAAEPSNVEYVFSLDEDDTASVAATEGQIRVVNPATTAVTSVRNWNAAAAAASGELLFVIADDLFPPAEWDTDVIAMLGRLDHCRGMFAIMAQDCD